MPGKEEERGSLIVLRELRKAVSDNVSTFRGVSGYEKRSSSISLKFFPLLALRKFLRFLLACVLR